MSEPEGDFIKKRFQHRFLPVNIAKYLRATIPKTSAKDYFFISENQTKSNVIYTLAENMILIFEIYKIFSYVFRFANFSST